MTTSMPSLEQLTSLPNGAKFYRADLHVHSFGGSHDVADQGATPSNLVEAAIKERIDVIAIADHNEVANVQAAQAAAVGKPILVIPAVELSTSSGHLLCYLPDLERLQKFFGQLDLADRGTANSRCQTALLECLKLLEQHGGFGVLAHVDGPGGFEIQTTGNSPHKLDVLSHRRLLGIELREAASAVSYSDLDPDANRVAIGADRIKRLGLGSKQYLTRVLNSDAHSLAALGRNAQGDRKITRFKMASPSFDSLRIALEDGDARVRIEDEIPNAVPYVEALHLEGGFLDGQQIHFSRNLNCIIGGRGTGKSTTFEAIRCISGLEASSSVVDSEVWPAMLSLFWRDQAGESHQLTRAINCTPTNLSNPQVGPISFHLESFGQGETARISKEAHQNPLALLAYLDRLVDLARAKEEENGARGELLEIQTQIEEATKNVDRIPLCERDLATTQQQLAALEKAKAKELIELMRKLAHDRQVRASIVTKLRDIKAALESQAVRATVEELNALTDSSKLAVGGKAFGAIVESANKFLAEVTAAQERAKASFETLRSAAESQMATWKAAEGVASMEIETKRKALEAQSIRLDMVYYEKLAADEARLKTDLATLKTWKPHLTSLKGNYAAASKRRWAARDRVATVRESFAKVSSETLKNALSDVQVSLKFLRSSHAPDLEGQISNVMGWRTSQVPRARLLIETLTVPGLLTAIDKRESSKIAAIKNPQGTTVFSAADADLLIERLAQPAMRFALERTEVHDLPRLSVTKAASDGKGGQQFVTKEFTKLSLGQQQSTLLALMLSSKSNVPLIIDQPEDNLDGEFIYHSLVPVLRLAKERRQIIIVTHNANIAVLGDAEQIVVLKSTSNRGTITSRGSIDDVTTRSEACNILEGAKEAFRRRARIYGSN